MENGDARRRTESGEYWTPQEEHYYGQSNKSATSVRSDGSGGRWHYPANFEDTLEVPSHKKSSKKKKERKDRWARTEDAYTMSDTPPISRRRKSKKRHTAETDTLSRESDSTAGVEFPEDPEGGLYGDTKRVPEQEEVIRQTNEDDIFTHQF